MWLCQGLSPSQTLQQRTDRTRGVPRVHEALGIAQLCSRSHADGRGVSRVEAAEQAGDLVAPFVLVFCLGEMRVGVFFSQCLEEFIFN